MDDKLQARYFMLTDKCATTLGDYSLNERWWSRFYEYQWAVEFLNKDDTIIDLGCGLEHPFKFYAAEKVKKVYAVDNHADILDFTKIEQNIEKWLNKDTAIKAKKVHKGTKLEIKKIDMTELELNFKEESIDKAFAISVFEHVQHLMEPALNQLYKILKPGGQVIMTFDHPTMLPETALDVIKRTKFKILGSDPNFTNKFVNVVRDRHYGLRCFRIVVGKEQQEVTQTKRTKKTEVK